MSYWCSACFKFYVWVFLLQIGCGLELLLRHCPLPVTECLKLTSVPENVAHMSLIHPLENKRKTSLEHKGHACISSVPQGGLQIAQHLSLDEDKPHSGPLSLSYSNDTAMYSLLEAATISCSQQSRMTALMQEELVDVQ